LSLHCPRCASLVDDPLARFCQLCGASLDAAAAQPTVAVAAAAGAVDSPRCPMHPQSVATDLCARCGSFVCPACVSASPEGQSQCPACATRQGEVWRVPWEERRTLGLFQGYWRTTKEVMFRPNVVLERLAPETGRWWDPLSYAIVSSFVGVSGLLLFYVLVFGVGLASALATVTERSGPGGGMIALVVVGLVLVMAISVPLGTLTGVFVLGGIEHLCLKLLGVKTRSFEATIRASCYSHAPMALGVIPVCGMYAYPIYQLVCRIFGYKGVHKTTGVKATFGVLLPAGLCFAGFMALYLAAFLASFAART
jgi:hypothetical protein